MVFFWMVMAVLALECLLSLWWLRRLWRHVRHPAWRMMLAAVMAGVALSMAWFIASRMGWLPKIRALNALGMLWALLAVPFGVIPCLLCWTAWDLAGTLRLRRKERLGRLAGIQVSDPAPAAAPGGLRWTRRQLLGTGLAATPLAATYAAAGVGVSQIWNFRRRRLDVPVTGLPPELEGLRILHLSDTHVGGFTPSENLRAIAQAVADEKPELILFTGDLIDHANRDLPVSIAFCEKLRAIAPLFFCEGNHDRIDDAEFLRAQMRGRGFAWLTDGQCRTLLLRGRRVQVLGASWSFGARGHEAAIAQCAASRETDAFPLLMAHHPDAFDAAAAADFPLMLAGHSHGGQLMLTERLGAGPVAFNYWSGLYRKAGSSLVVSNGIGHWFPLRLNAPAEIAVLRLARAG